MFNWGILHNTKATHFYLKARYRTGGSKKDHGVCQKNWNSEGQSTRVPIIKFRTKDQTKKWTVQENFMASTQVTTVLI